MACRRVTTVQTIVREVTSRKLQQKLLAPLLIRVAS